MNIIITISISIFIIIIIIIIIECSEIMEVRKPSDLSFFPPLL